MVDEEIKKAVEESQEIDTDQIEKALGIIDGEVSSLKEQTKELSVKTEETKEHTIDELTDLAINKMNKIDATTDEIYQLFYTPIALRQDRSDASKIALLDSQHIKVDLINALANLATAKAKLEAAKTKVPTGNVGVFLGAKDGNSIGINLEDVKSFTDED
jgi:hypothetical protein